MPGIGGWFEDQVILESWASVVLVDLLFFKNFHKNTQIHSNLKEGFNKEESFRKTLERRRGREKLHKNMEIDIKLLGRVK